MPYDAGVSFELEFRVVNDPDFLVKLIAEQAEAMRRAFYEGYRKGAEDAREMMFRAVSHTVEKPLQRAPEHPPEQQANGHRLSPPRVGLAEAPRMRYGLVIAHFRKALLSRADVGVTKDELFEFCSRQGVDLTINQYRDTIKRLAGGEEVIRKDGLYYPGPRLRGFTATDGKEAVESMN